MIVDAARGLAQGHADALPARGDEIVEDAEQIDDARQLHRPGDEPAERQGLHDLGDGARAGVHGAAGIDDDDRARHQLGGHRRGQRAAFDASGGRADVEPVEIVVALEREVAPQVEARQQAESQRQTPQSTS